MKQKTKKHLLIGGPGTGKSSTLDYIEKLGFKCFPEIAREITLAAQQKGIDQLFLTDPLAFSNALLDGRIEQFNQAGLLQNKVVFIDRGIPDISAYLDFAKQNYPNNYKIANQKYIYDKVFHFPIWKEIFMNDNERYEGFKELNQIDLCLKSTYKNLGYNLIEVPKASIKERADFIIQHS
ncbi:AAA family ATPase [Psychroflexus salis]|uniref:ATPase n=1 Tax=Psychroflexus salis TaxID=1526574 RepID=A0A917E6N9_9FLAO|nr:ATP-binding protein [Psychroflexus salis]GGE09791.1 ATPase [Psychroflexus salis]